MNININESKRIIENTIQLCNREREIKREKQELQKSVKEKNNWLEKYIISQIKNL